MLLFLFILGTLVSIHMDCHCLKALKLVSIKQKLFDLLVLSFNSYFVVLLFLVYGWAGLFLSPCFWLFSFPHGSKFCALRCVRLNASERARTNVLQNVRVCACMWVGVEEREGERVNWDHKCRCLLVKFFFPCPSFLAKKQLSRYF